VGYWAGSKDVMYAEGWVTPNGAGPVADADPHLYAATGTGALTSFFGDGTLVQSNNGGVQGPGQLSLGGLGVNSNEGSVGDVSEVLIYNRVLSDAEQNQVGFYLEQKYLGLAGVAAPGRRRRRQA
jgi:hypothetical protein